MQVNIALLTVTDTRTIDNDKSGGILVKKIAEQNGCKNFVRVPALGTKHEFINSLANLVFNSNLSEKKSAFCHPSSKCPNNFKKCPCSVTI